MCAEMVQQVGHFNLSAAFRTITNTFLDRSKGVLSLGQVKGRRGYVLGKWNKSFIALLSSISCIRNYQKCKQLLVFEA